MSSRAVRLRRGEPAQIDAFAAPVVPRPAVFKEVASAPRVEPRELWVGLHLPQLSGGAQDEPGHERQRRAVLESVAMRALRFTPRVSLAPPDELLLEVRGSLHLFGGAEGLCSTLAAQYRSAGFDPLLALAPTPLAALAWARSASSSWQTRIVTDPARLVGEIASLSLTALRWPDEVIARLAKIGVYTVAQVLRLPRAGFARRFGGAQLASLDRLTGRAADPQVAFHAPERFRRRCELFYELDDQAVILKALMPVLQELEQFLQARGSGITQLEYRLHHRHAVSTRCVLKLAAPTADAQRLSELLGERLLACVLPEPVRSCELRTGWLVPRPLNSNALWQAGEQGGSVSAGSIELVEHLRARLGSEAVYGLAKVDEHRPETAWRIVEPGVADRLSSRERGVFEVWRRPLWLLPAPQFLLEKPLRILNGPERIETGWWDGAEIARDYYTALNPHGVRLWIFREHAAPRRWFLQGVFG